MIAICLVLVATPSIAQQALTFAMPDDGIAYSSLAVLKEAYSRLDIPVEGAAMPAARALAESDRGRTDGEVNRIASIEPAHPDLIRIDVPVNYLEGIAYTCDPKIIVSGWESIRLHRVGIKIGIQYAEQRTQDMPHVTRVHNFNKLFDLLFAGRLDVVVASREMGNLQFARQPGRCLIANVPPLESLPLYHYLHKSNANLVPAITDVLRKMSDSGEAAAIRERATADFRARLR